VLGVLLAGRAEFRQFQSIGIVTAVLLGDVVAVLTLLARQSDLRPDIGCFAHGALL